MMTEGLGTPLAYCALCLEPNAVALWSVYINPSKPELAYFYHNQIPPRSLEFHLYRYQNSPRLRHAPHYSHAPTNRAQGGNACASHLIAVTHQQSLYVPRP